MMMLIRSPSTMQGTPGMLYLLGMFVCRMMELPWRDNAPDISCIPEGEYDVRYLERSASGHFRDCYHIMDVPDRSGVLIHKGNWAGATDHDYRTDSHGCALTATRFGILAGQIAGLASRGAMTHLHEITGRRDFRLRVQNA